MRPEASRTIVMAMSASIGSPCDLRSSKANTLWWTVSKREDNPPFSMRNDLA
jgi:hypothetical protein